MDGVTTGRPGFASQAPSTTPKTTVLSSHPAIERGERNVSLATLELIAEGLGLKPSELLN